MSDYILSIETSSTNCSVALSSGDALVHCIENQANDFRHSDHLHRFIEQLMAETQLTFRQLSAVAVSKGPGSYTGLRIGVSTAKGLCYANDLPLLSVNSLRVLAQQYSAEENDLVFPLVDARRLEVFILGLDDQYNSVLPTQALVLDEPLPEILQQKNRKVFMGSGAEKCKPYFTENVLFCEDILFPSAKDMVSLVYRKLKANTFEDVAYFEPFYLKDFFTTAKLKK